jgi:hypothetical protein
MTYHIDKPRGHVVTELLAFCVDLVPELLLFKAYNFTLIKELLPNFTSENNFYHEG